jgi:hypothetical protein
MLRICLDVVLQVFSLSPYRREPFLRSAFLGQGAVLNHLVPSLPQNVFVLYLPVKTLKSNSKLKL